MSQENNAGYWLANFGKALIALVVMAFLGLHSVNFFGYAFPADQQIYAWLGFGLTGGAVFVYLALIKWGRLTGMSKAVALIMLIVSVLGELAAAGFGMQIETWARAGLELTEETYQVMVLVVQGLGLAHALALIIMVVGEDVVAMFRQPVFSYSVQNTSAEVGAMFRDGVQHENKTATSKR